MSRRTGLETNLQLLENSFEQKLTAALRECAAGYLGLFGVNDAALVAAFRRNAGRYLSARRRELLEQGADIEALRNRLGYVEPNRLFERFKAYSRKATEANAVGEAKLAQIFLSEMLENEE